MSTKKTPLENIIMEDLKRLARLIGVDLSYGWKTRLADRLGVPRDYLHKWAQRERVPNNQLLKIREMGFPEETWYSPAIEAKKIAAAAQEAQENETRDMLVKAETFNRYDWLEPLLTACERQKDYLVEKIIEGISDEHSLS